jgi:Asp-tRNA(Asn)/Glu-tRNA(Gln) amidotransferase A subunit family amidase
MAIRDAGAVIVGIANMHEYGAGSTGHISAFGPARNPWNTDRCPGGSSSGSGAAVAARLVSGAVGADGIGSIRYPAAYCGLTGLKPTFGRSTMQGHHATSTTTIVSGPMCRDAADCRLLGGVLFGGQLTASEPDGLRIGIVPGELWDDCDPEVNAACRQAAEALREAGARPDLIDPGRLDRGARRHDPRACRRPRRRRQPGRPGTAALPAPAACRGDLEVVAGAHPGAAVARRAVRTGRCARLAHRRRAGAAVG